MKIMNVFFLSFLMMHCAQAQNEKKLFDAVKKENSKEVETLIRQGANVNAHTGDEYVKGETALMMAARQGNIAIMQKLIAAGADVNAVSGREQPHMGKPVLRYAIDSESPLAVRVLLRAGADANELTSSPVLNVRNIPLLSYAIDKHAPIEIINGLLAIKGGADVNKKAFLVDLTPLMIASYTGYTDAVKALLAAGADPNIKNKQDGNKTALDYAKKQGHKGIIELLQK